MALALDAARSMVARLDRIHACGPDAFLLELRLPEALEELAPGAFAMLSPADGSGPVIARPFSVYQQIDAQRVSFMVQVLGAGTRTLCALQADAELRLTVPLGNGFVLPAPERPVVLLAGGVGCAPFLLYAQRRIAAGAGAQTSMLYGARSADRLYDLPRFAAMDFSLLTATDDGSSGFHGNVVQLLEQSLEQGRWPAQALFCACGPEGLLHAFAACARRRGLEAELSLETYMGCGFGVCNACPVPTDPEGPLGHWPWARTCVDGPVFSLSAIRF